MLIRHAAMQSSPPKLYADDVFQSYTRTGTGAEQTVTTNIDMTQDYMVWSKGRSGTTDHAIYDSVRGTTKDLVTNSTAAATTQSQGLKSVSSTGHTWGTLAKVNTSTATYVDWIYRVAPKFFALSQVVKSAGSDATVSFSNLETLGMVIVKRTDSTGSWYVWHRSLTAGKLLYLEQTVAEATLGHITVSGTTVTLENGVIADGTYIVYAYAHDTAADGLIQCGSFTTDGSGNATVNLGWEPQFAVLKRTDSTGNWTMLDSARGMTVNAGSTSNLGLYAENSTVEIAGVTLSPLPNATGFTVANVGPSCTYIYLAIRRSNKPPTSGTQVYNAIARTGTGAAATITGVGFSPDLVVPQARAGNDAYWFDRLRGTDLALKSAGTLGTLAEASGAGSYIPSFNMDGFNLGNSSVINQTSISFINWCFRRAKGFFDNFCWTGNGINRTISHNLGVVPDLLIFKSRSATGDWQLWFNGLTAIEKIILNSTAAKVTDTTLLNSVLPTNTLISLGTQAAVNTSSATYVGYAFANLTGIQSIGSYTGNGSSQDLNFGFNAGTRFFLCKAVSTTGSFWVFDSTRGIVANADFGLQLNSTAAEITSADCVDPLNTGITIIEEATCHLNTNGVTYFYWAIA